MIDKSKKYFPAMLLIAIILLHITSNYVWLKKDDTYLMHDAHHNFLFSLGVFHQIQESFIPFLSDVFSKIIYHRWHGVLVGYLTAPFYFIFGAGQDIGVMVSSTIFLSILILSVYGIGKLIHSRASGLLSAFLISIYPMVFNHLRTYMLDLPLTSMVSLSVYLLLRTKLFSQRLFSLFFGISMGLGLLTKFNFIGFIIGPLLFIFYKAFNIKQSKINTERKKIFHFFIIICLSFILVLPFLRIKFWEVFSRFYECSWLNPVFNTSYDSVFILFVHWFFGGWQFIVWCFREMKDSILSPLFFLIFIISFFMFKRSHAKYRSVFYLWILFPVFVLSFVFHYPAINRYLMPCLPAIAIVSAIGLMTLKPVFLRRIIIFLVISCGVVQYFIISYGYPAFFNNSDASLPKIVSRLKNSISYRDVPIDYRNGLNRGAKPSLSKWPVEEILNKLLIEARGCPQKITVFFIDPVPEIYEPIEYLCLANNYPIEIHVNSLSEEESYRDKEEDFEPKNMPDYVLMVDNPDRANDYLPISVKERINNSRKNFQNIQDEYALCNVFRLSEESNILLFRDASESVRLETPLITAVFKRGRVRLFFNDYPDSEPLFIVNSFDFEGEKYLSTEMEWEINKSSKKTIMALGKLKNSALRQTWSFSVNENQEGEFNAIVSAEEEIKDSIFSIEIPSYYQEWETSLERGEFGKKTILRYCFRELLSPVDCITFCKLRRRNVPRFTLLPSSGECDISSLLAYKKDRRIVQFRLSEQKNNQYSLDKSLMNSFTLKIKFD